jgi:transposase
MDVVVSGCAGIDIGKAEVVAYLWVPGPRGKRVSHVQTFSAVPAEMTRLADWLAEHQVSHVVMEATGQYWRSVWDVLAERGFELMLVNARHVKMVPGRKTDVADATWLAELLEHGLLRGSFVPPRGGIPKDSRGPSGDPARHLLATMWPRGVHLLTRRVSSRPRGPFHIV